VTSTNQIVTVVNQKGGVGKTTVTLGLAAAAASSGRDVLVVDLDPQASSTWVLGLDGPVESSTADVLSGTSTSLAAVTSPWSGADAGYGLTGTIDVIPASSRLQDLDDGDPSALFHALELHLTTAPSSPQRYDAVLIDCPPSLGNLTRNALTAARHALIVVEPSALGLRGIGGVADVIDDVWDRSNSELELAGVVLNRVPATSREADRRIAELARIVGGETIWTPHVPQRVILNEAIGRRRPIHSLGARADDVVVVFDRLWARLRRTISS
jgi:cellulose biosynthesis protein BcsQ